MHAEPALTADEVLERARASGLEITERTLRYYALQGLLPPVRRGAADAADRRVRYYPASVLQRLADIRDLQHQGYSLRQIRDYLGLTGLVVESAAAPAPCPPQIADTGSVADVPLPLPATLDARALLEAIAGPAVAASVHTFLAKTSSQRSEAAFRQAAVEHFRTLLALHVGAERAESVLQEAVAPLTPVQWDRLLGPLRTLRNQQWKEEARRRGLPFLERARALAAKVVAGGQALPADLDEVRALATDLHTVSLRLQARCADLGPSLTQVGRWAREVGATLADAMGRLAEALACRELSQVGASLQVMEAQARRLERLIHLLSEQIELIQAEGSPPSAGA